MTLLKVLVWVDVCVTLWFMIANRNCSNCNTCQLFGWSVGQLQTNVDGNITIVTHFGSLVHAQTSVNRNGTNSHMCHPLLFWLKSGSMVHKHEQK